MSCSSSAESFDKNIVGYLLDVSGLLDRLATRRYIEDPNARPSWWTPHHARLLRPARAGPPDAG